VDLKGRILLLKLLRPLKTATVNVTTTNGRTPMEQFRVTARVLTVLVVGGAMYRVIPAMTSNTPRIAGITMVS